MASAVARDQGPPLWAMRLAFLQNRNPNRFPDGIASWAKPNAGCARARSGSTSPPTPTHEELSPSIPKPSASPPTTASDAADLASGSLLAGQCPAVIPASPIMSAIPTTAPATAANSAIGSHHRGARSGHRSRAPFLPESSAGRALQ